MISIEPVHRSKPTSERRPLAEASAVRGVPIGDWRHGGLRGWQEKIGKFWQSKWTCLLGAPMIPTSRFPSPRDSGFLVRIGASAFAMMQGSSWYGPLAQVGGFARVIARFIFGGFGRIRNDTPECGRSRWRSAFWQTSVGARARYRAPHGARFVRQAHRPPIEYYARDR